MKIVIRTTIKDGKEGIKGMTLYEKILGGASVLIIIAQTIALSYIGLDILQRYIH